MGSVQLDGMAIARITTEAVEVATETGMTPRQLLAERDRLLAALQASERELSMLANNGAIKAVYRDELQRIAGALAKADGRSSAA